MQPKPKVWTAEQLGAFLDAIEGQRLYPLYHLAAFAGMRRGELCGISWDDVDLAGGRITVRWQITDRAYREARAAEKRGEIGRYRSKPKTRAGEDRVVDLDSVSVAVLREWRKRQMAERLDWDRPTYIRSTRTASRTTSCSPVRTARRSTLGAPIPCSLTWSARLGCRTSSCTACGT